MSIRNNLRTVGGATSYTSSILFWYYNQKKPLRFGWSVGEPIHVSKDIVTLSSVIGHIAFTMDQAEGKSLQYVRALLTFCLQLLVASELLHQMTCQVRSC